MDRRAIVTFFIGLFFTIGVLAQDQGEGSPPPEPPQTASDQNNDNQDDQNKDDNQGDQNDNQDNNDNQDQQAEENQPPERPPQQLETKVAKKKDKNKKRIRRMYAVLDTNYGKIKMRLYHRRIPKLVAHFFGLAEGTLASINPKSGKKEKKRFYDGLTFHRVIPNFIIQGGDPLANSKGGPGYNMPEEYHPSLKHDRPGVVSLANSGPNTTGSQFFITLKPNPKLDHDHPTNAGSGRGYSIIGQVVKGMGVVKKISTVKRDTFDKPLKPVIIKTIKIERIYK